MFSSPPCLEVRTMSSRVRTLVKATFAVFVVLGTVMATSVPARADMGTPAWHIGDWWHYRLTNASSPAGGTGPGTLEIIVIGTTDVTVAGVIYPTYDTKDWVNVTSGSVTYSIAGDEWFRTSDLSSVQVALAFTTTYLGTTVTVSVAGTAAPPQEMRWPLSAGAMWLSVSNFTTTTVTTIGGSSTSNTTLRSIDYEYTVQTTTEVAVPKGTFSVTPVQQTEIGVPGDTVAYWSGDVGNYAKQAAYDSNGDERSSGELTAYHYAPPLGGSMAFLGIAAGLWLIIIGVVIAVAIVVVLVLGPRRAIPSQVVAMQPSETLPRPPDSSGPDLPETGLSPPPP